MDIFDLITLLGGLGFFLYGMTLMGSGLKSAAGSSLESFLEKLSSTTLRGVLLGTVVTAIIQSSSATTVMVVGFVNSGIMKLAQAVGIVMGANIGTTVTGWILCLADVGGGTVLLEFLKPSTFAPLMVLIGTIMVAFIKDTKKQNIGYIVLGFGTLMVGMSNMSAAAAPLADMPEFVNLVTLFSNPLLGIVVGTLMTAVVQSSSASVGILQALALSGILPYSTVVPMVLGIGIGACMPVMLSSIGANANGKRTALLYLYFNLIRTAMIVPIFYAGNAIFQFPFMSQNADMFGVAMINTLFNVFATLVLLPFNKLLAKLATISVRDDKHTEAAKPDTILELIDKHFLATPEYALRQCHTVIAHMADLDLYNIKSAIALQDEFKPTLSEEIEKNENLADEYEDALGSYLVEISRLNLPARESYIASMYIHTVGDLERISDHSMNLCELATKMHREKISFSDAAKLELDTLNEAITEILTLTVKAFNDEDMQAAMSIEPLEEVIDILCAGLKDRHVTRLQQGLCSIPTGFVFNDLLNNYERISDHCSNVAIYVLRSRDKVFDPHKYLLDISHEEYFENMCAQYKDKYCKNIGIQV
ncbi:MAG: Na/Pi cotransporter family protein [Clostridiales bacterium]|nr:Na/Pi cotransporter family protein [Clostridiales bacterium]